MYSFIKSLHTINAGVFGQQQSLALDLFIKLIRFQSLRAEGIYWCMEGNKVCCFIGYYLIGLANTENHSELCTTTSHGIWYSRYSSQNHLYVRYSLRVETELH